MDERARRPRLTQPVLHLQAKLVSIGREPRSSFVDERTQLIALVDLYCKPSLSRIEQAWNARELPSRISYGSLPIGYRILGGFDPAPDVTHEAWMLDAFYICRSQRTFLLSEPAN